MGERKRSEKQVILQFLGYASGQNVDLREHRFGYPYPITQKKTKELISQYLQIHTTNHQILRTKDTHNAAKELDGEKV